MKTVGVAMRTPMIICLMGLLATGMVVGAEKPVATQAASQGASGDVVGDWGEKTGGFQVRLVVKAGASKGGPFPVVAEIKNTSDAKVANKQLRVWLMIAQGPQQAYYSDAVALGARTFAAGETISVPVKAGELAAFRYGEGLELREGVPVPADLKAAKPKSVGKVSEVMPAGSVKLRAFFVGSEGMDPELREKVKTQVISSATVTVKVPDKAAQ